MADNLIFPIGFDLEAAVKSAGDEWDKKYADRLEKLIAKRSVTGRVALKLDNLEDVKRRLAELRLEPITPETKTAIRELARELQSLARALEQVQKYSTGRVTASPDAVRAARIDEINSRKEARVAVEREKARAHAARAAAAEYRLAQARTRAAEAAGRGASATRQANAELHRQEGYVSRLVKRLAVYAGFRQIANFLTSVREVTAEFELQRVSLGAIIQNQQRANQLFSEIKAFALQSPVSILDLTKYTKQLAAYKIGVDELFETTKKLTDVSVGLGVSMDRVVLAYGQTRATGYLRASEIRQFTEMGIPIVEELAKKLTRMNGELVTAAQVMDMVSKRGISFKLVKDVFDDMTSAGGMFYNMQEKQGNTLAGMWAKLGDAASVMYEQIGNTESVNSAMKGTIQLLTDLMRNWREVGRAMGAAGAGFAAVWATKKVKGWQSGLDAARVAANKQYVAASEVYQAALRAEQAARATATAEEYKAIAAKTESARASYDAARAEYLSASRTTLLGKAWGRLKTVMAGSWPMMVVGGIMAIGTAIYNAAQKAGRLTKELKEIRAQGEIDTAKSVFNFEKLAQAAVGAATGSRQQREALAELKRTYGDIIPEQELTIEKLKAMRGEYTSLTLAIRQYIAEQSQQKQVDAIVSETESDIIAAERRIKAFLAGKTLKADGKKIKLNFSTEQIDKAVAGMRELAGTSVSAYDMVRKAFKLYAGIDLTDTAVDVITRYSDGLLKGSVVQNAFWSAIRRQQKEISRVVEDMSGLTAQTGIFADRWKQAQQNIQDATLTATEGTKLFDLQRMNASIREYGDALADDFAKVGIELGEGWRRTVKEINSEKDGLSTIDFDALIAIAREKGKDYSVVLENAVRVAKRAYDALFDTEAPAAAGRERDGRVETLKEMARAIREMFERYKEYEQLIGKGRAAKFAAKTYSQELAYLNEVGAAFGLKFDLPQTRKDLMAYQTAIYNAMAKINTVVARRGLISLGKTIDSDWLKNLGEDIQLKLGDLADEIARSRSAKEFYERILGQTGDMDLAGSLTLELYGASGKELNRQIRERIEQMVEGTSATIDVKLFRSDDTFDPKALRAFAEANKEALGNAYKELIKISEEAEKDFQKTIEGWLKATEKAKTYSDKLLDLARKTQTELSRIERERGNVQVELGNLLEIGDPTDEQKKRIESLVDMLEVYDELRERFEEKQTKEQASLAYEAFKDSPMYVQMFDDLDGASTRMLENMRSRLVALQGEWKNLDPTQLKEMQSRLNEIDAQLVRRNPFKTLGNAIGKYRKMMQGKDEDGGGFKSAGAADVALQTATDNAKKAADEYKALLKKYSSGNEKTAEELAEEHKDLAQAKKDLDAAMANEEAAAKAVENWKKVKDAIGLSANELFSMLNWAGDIASAVADISEALGADEEDVQYWNTVADSLSGIAGGIQDIVSAAMSGNVVGIVSSVLTAIPKMFTGFVNLFNADRIRDANKEIKEQAELLEQLGYTFSQLEKEAEKVFGVDYLANYNRQLKILNAQAEAYRKQAEAERSKGKKADKEKVKEYEDAVRDTMNSIADMQGALMEKFTGTSRYDAAKQMAQSWLDAKASLSDTYSAIYDDYKDMIKNMIVEGAAARVIEQALAPMWESVDRMLQNNDIDGAVSALVGGMDEALNAANKGMEVLWTALEARGYDMQQLIGDVDTSYTGIKRDIASASEETMSSVAAIGNTLLYYVSPLPGVANDVAAIRQAIERGLTAPVASEAGGEWTDWQQQAMNSYLAIQRNTADTVVECRRAALAAEGALAQLKRVITNNPSATSYGVKVFA